MENTERHRPQQTPPPAHSGPLAWVKLRSASASPNLFKRMIDEIDFKARPGDFVAAYDRHGLAYGVALYNPKSLITLRLFSKDIPGFTPEAVFGKRIEEAVFLRKNVMKLDATTDAYRLVHDVGDGLPGLVADRYGNHIVLEFYSLGMYKNAALLEQIFAKHFPSAKFSRRASQYTETMEGFRCDPVKPAKVRIQENEVQFEVEISAGYKTGFFCDQRENRLIFSKFCNGKKVLDLCSYTGGFGIYAKKRGLADEVTCVELDEEAYERMKRNANINGVRINTVNADAFAYLRQMGMNGVSYDTAVLDPHKLISSREGFEEGRRKYLDFNRLGISLVRPGGIFLTCSCSGLLQWPDFVEIVRSAAMATGRRVQIFRKTGAGPDHPFAVEHPEGEYLKAMWCRVLSS